MKKSRIQKYFFFALALILLESVFYFGWNYASSKTTCIALPVKFSRSNLPIIDVMIEDKLCSLMLDIGSKFPIEIDVDFFKTINKRQLDSVKWRDWKGDPHEAQSFLIPKVNINGLTWTSVIGIEMMKQNKESATLWKDESQQSGQDEFIGMIGVPFLEKTNLCLDLYHKTIFCCNSLRTLQKKGICPKNMIKVPFHLNKGDIIVRAETDVGKLNLCLDTGATISIIKSSLKNEILQLKDRRGFPYFTTDQFELAGKNFGQLEIFLLELDPKFEGMDGILGMNFLKNHIIYIDYPNRYIYLGD